MTNSISTPTARRRRVRYVAGGLAVILAGMLALIAWWWNQDPDAEAPILPTSTPVPQARVYVVDADQSRLEVTVDATTGKVEGGYDMGLGTVELVPTGEGWQVNANLTFDARTLDVGNDTLNGIMRRALNVEQYPTGTFVAASETPISGFDAPVTVDLVGQIELHGTVQDYTIPTTITLNGDEMTLDSDLVIDARVFGADIPGLFASDELDADLTVVLYEGEPPAQLDATLTPSAD